MNQFDPTQVFDEDYLYFYGPLLSDARSDRDAEVIAKLAGIRAGDRVLDLACGHGRIANRLALRGPTVTGIDLNPGFLELARTDGARRGVSVEYVQGDMANLSWCETFDVVVSWFTSFGYFDDVGNDQVLESVHRSLRPGGRFVLELNHAPGLLGAFVSFGVTRIEDDLMIDERRFDPQTWRLHTQRTVLRNGSRRSFECSNRVFALPELTARLRAIGFENVCGFGPEGASLERLSPRMIVRACRS